MAVLSIVNGNGHSIVTFAPDDTTEAEAEFDKARSYGHIGFVDGNPITEFDPEAEHILMTPVVTGG